MNVLSISDDAIENFDPNEILDYFLKHSIESLDIYAPLVTRKVRRNSNIRVTAELKNNCRERDLFYKRAKRTGDQNLLKLYKLKRKQIKIKLNAARENYLKYELTNLPCGQSIWCKLKRLGLIKSNFSPPLRYFDSPVLNEFYTKIVRKHAPCDILFLNSLAQNYASKVGCIYNWSQIDIVDVTKALQLTLQKSKGRSPDGLRLG